MALSSSNMINNGNQIDCRVTNLINTIFFGALYVGDIQTVETFLTNSRGTELVNTTYNGLRPLHLAAGTGQSHGWALLHALLRNRADPDGRCGDDALTPLHVAVLNDRPERVATLLAFGANPCECDSRGFNPEEYSVLLGHHGCERLLRDSLYAPRFTNNSSAVCNPNSSGSLIPRNKQQNREYSINGVINSADCRVGTALETKQLLSIEYYLRSFVAFSPVCIARHRYTMPSIGCSDILLSSTQHTIAIANPNTTCDVTEKDIVSYVNPPKTEDFTGSCPPNGCRNGSGDAKPTKIRQIETGSQYTVPPIETETKSIDPIEIIHRDPINGDVYYERKFSLSSLELNFVTPPSSLPPSLTSSPASSLPSSSDSYASCLSDWKDYQSDTEDIKINCRLDKLSNKVLRVELTTRFPAFVPGPITAATRPLYLRKLRAALAEDKRKPIGETNGGSKEFPREVSLILREGGPVPDMGDVEDRLIEEFGRSRQEGLVYYTYLLLDPRVTRGLHRRRKGLTDSEGFSCFLRGIFYVGKGTKLRPFSHFHSATNGSLAARCPKAQHIRDIWDTGSGVVVLQCFQGLGSQEAHAREALMIDALGLKRLTNRKLGTYYGVASGWTLLQKRRMGLYLISLAWEIYKGEGERQIRPP